MSDQVNTFFPRHVLPELVASYVRAQARSTGLSHSMLAMPLLAAVGSAIGRQARLELREDWIERPGLWVVVATPPGMGKTLALTTALEPLLAAQELAHVEWEAERAAAEGWHNLGGARQRPVMDRLYTTEVRMRLVTSWLQGSPGLKVLYDDLAPLLGVSRGQTVLSEERRRLPSVWSGQPLVPMQARGGGGYVREPVVSICGGVNLEALGRAAQDRWGGLLERFLPVLYVAVEREREEAGEEKGDSAALAHWLWWVRRSAFRAHPEGLTVRPSPNARELWEEWMAGTAAARMDGEPLPTAFGRKLPAQVARLALVLHVLGHAEGEPVRDELEPEVMAGAIALGDLAWTHVEAVVGLAETWGTKEARKSGLDRQVVSHLEERKRAPGAGWASRTDLWREVGRPDVKTFASVLEELMGAGELEHLRERVGGAKKPSDLFRLLGEEE